MVRYVATPTSMLNVKEIKPLDMILYGRIIALSRVKGYCFSMDEMLADTLHTSRSTIQRSLTRLEHLNYIVRVNKYRGSSVIERHIYPFEVYKKVAIRNKKTFPKLKDQVENLKHDKKDIVSNEEDYFKNIIDEYFKMEENP